MKIVVLQGSPRVNGNTARLVSKFKEGAESAGHEVDVVNVGSMKISGCTGCEYCHGAGNGECAIKDDMQKVYASLADAEMVVFASAVYYWSMTAQLQATLTRFYSIEHPAKATKYAVIVTSASPGVYDAIKSQFADVIDYFGAENVGMLTAFGSERTSESKLAEAFEFGKNI